MCVYPKNAHQPWPLDLKITVTLGTLTYGRGPPGPVVNSVLCTPDGVVDLRPNAMSRPRKAAGLLKSLVRSPLSSAARGPDGAEKVEFLERSN